MESSAAHRGRHWGMLVVSVETTTRQPFFLDAGAKYGDILFFSKPSGNSACPEMRIETLSWQWRFLLMIAIVREPNSKIGKVRLRFRSSPIKLGDRARPLV
jgi:hypothetical protein